MNAQVGNINRFVFFNNDLLRELEVGWSDAKPVSLEFTKDVQLVQTIHCIVTDYMNM